MNIYIWGRSGDGRLGLGDDTRDRYEPTLLDARVGGNKIEWIQIECGGLHTVGLTKNGEVFTWGSDISGELGHGHTKSRRVPTKVESLDGLFINKISCVSTHTAALTYNGEISTWGSGYDGQLGHNNRNNQRTPKKVDALAGEMIVHVACGWRHTCAVTSTGSILTWGFGIATGHGVYRIIFNPSPLQDLSSKGVASVSANKCHTACITKAGEVFTWGEGEDGKLGHGDETNQEFPKRVEALVGQKATMVSCGVHHTVVCTEDGHVYTFGLGEYGQLGHGDKENLFSPALVQALEGKHITQVQCGCNYTMVLTSSGYVFTWGYAENGRLGHGYLKPKKYLSIPCLVEGLREHNVVQITSGYSYCAVLVDPANPCVIRESQQASFNNKLHSDVVLMVENEPLHANVDFLSQKSDYFAAMFRCKMRESIERVVQVPNCSKASFLLVLEYLYFDGFTVSIDYAVELWVLADMYLMEGLKYYCMGALERSLSDENVTDILEELEELSCPCDELKLICHECLARHVED